MTIDHECDLCGNPTDGYCCQAEADNTARYLRRVVDLAAEVETNVARQARYATRGGRRAVTPDEDQATALVNRSQPVVAFGFAASKERPLKNALRAEPLPVDLNASSRAAVAFNHVVFWARRVEKDRGQVPDVQVGEHAAAVNASFLIANLEWMRHQEFAELAFDQLKAAGAVIERIVDCPPDEEVVGVCDCGQYLYARRNAAVVTCRCRLRWEVQASRVSLMDDLRGRLVTVAEAATLGVMAYPDLQRHRIRTLVQSWVRPDRSNSMLGVESPDGVVYPFGEILDRLSAYVIRVEQRDPAIVSG